MKNYSGREGFYLSSPKTEDDNSLRYLHNSLHHKKTEFNNCFVIHSRLRVGRLEHSTHVAIEDGADFTELLYKVLLIIPRTYLAAFNANAVLSLDTTKLCIKFKWTSP